MIQTTRSPDCTPNSCVLTGSSTIPAQRGGDRPASRVPKEYVHLSFEDKVYVTDWQRLDATRFLVTAVWRAGTSTSVPGGRHRHESVIAAQTVRQASLLLAHAEFGAPLKHQVLLRGFDFAFDPRRPGAVEQDAHLAIEVTCAPTGSRAGRTTGLRLTLDITCDGEPFGSARTAFEWIPPAVYRRLRGDHVEAVREQPPLPAPVPPHLVGRETEAEVVLSPLHGASEGPGRWLLRGDFTHVALFDHPVDHLPGLVMIEAAHQAARLVTAPEVFVPESVETTFDRYVEFDAPCTIDAERVADSAPGTTAVRVTGYQGGELAFTCVLTGASGPARGL
ncbi:ScbA/BarX family gamma-butyrolactone biosynthesis protein [Streptomyces gamaensis]|uniref:ScbA/BarX family gamma-butyrolactone biosynthesis protein n=1 Tax=Streptomyces gamaensis TaxID=1763542 RepID=A0ABW0Z291_9ACTN